MDIPFFQVHAFTRKLFSGNPAAVCPLASWLDDATLQSIAAENNLAETAYLIPADGDDYHLRWFTPTCEVDLCGHATLASAWVVLNRLNPGRDRVVFHTRSGPLTVTRDGELYALDFPSRPPTRINPTAEIIQALGAEPDELWKARDFMAVYRNETDIRKLTPDMTKLATLDTFAVIATAPGGQVDFVSRFFAPARGVPEDPVTGSAHTTLIPYWADRLSKTQLHAYQVSTRGGELFCELRGDRVTMAGEAVLFATGTIHLAD